MRLSLRDLPYYLLDVFTDRPFGGNPLAVFPDADEIPDGLMQQIASELNLSETTFIQKPLHETSDCTVRIFTPKSEVPMAGHPTIGTAYTILANQLIDPINPSHLVFDEGVGPVNVDFERVNGVPSRLFMHQRRPEFSEAPEKNRLAAVLSIDESDIEAALPVQIVSCGFPFLIVPISSLEAIQKIKVRLDLLESELADWDCKEILVYTRETIDPQSDVHCRMFAPRLGVPEDPATGGAHGPLGSYLVNHKLCSGNNIVSEQGYEMGRPSRITVRIATQQNEITDVAVGGDCVAMGKGCFQIA